MNIKIDIDITPEEFKDLVVPGDKQNEFMVKTYEAYVESLNRLMRNQIDPFNFFGKSNDS